MADDLDMSLEERHRVQITHVASPPRGATYVSDRFDSEVAEAEHLMELKDWDGLKRLLVAFDPESKSVVLRSVSNALLRIQEKKYASALSALKTTKENDLKWSNFIELFETNLETGQFIFNEKLASQYITDKDFDGLQKYLAQFLESNPIDESTDHPGFWLTFWELRLVNASVIGSTEQSKASFDAFTNNLLEKNPTHHRFWPLNLLSRVKKVNSYTSKSLSEADYKQCHECLLDYMRLYFRHHYWPEIKDDQPWHQFVRKEGNKIYCLACSYCPADQRGEKFVEYHLCPDVGMRNRKERCDAMTFHLAKKSYRVLLNRDVSSYEEYEKLYQPTKKRLTSSGTTTRSSDSASRSSGFSAYYEKSKRLRFGAEVKPIEGDTEDTSSSPDKEYKEIHDELGKVLGESTKLNMELSASAKGDDKLCSEQRTAISELGVEIYKYMRDSHSFEFVNKLSALDDINLKFISMKHNYPEWNDIIEKCYKLRKLLKSSVSLQKFCSQSHSFVICRLASRLVECELNITRLIQNNREKIDKSVLECCQSLNSQVGLLISVLHEEKLCVAALNDHIANLVKVKDNLVSFIKSLPELCLHVLELVEICYEIQKLCLRGNLNEFF